MITRILEVLCCAHSKCIFLTNIYFWSRTPSDPWQLGHVRGMCFLYKFHRKDKLIIITIDIEGDFARKLYHPRLQHILYECERKMELENRGD